MSLRARLVFFGAILPALLMMASVVLAGRIFEKLLLDAVDESMRTQAAVETVSLFDSPDRSPHVHLTTSPLAAEIGDAAARVGVYDSSGGLVAFYPSRARVPAWLSPREASSRRAPRTVESQETGPVRELTLVVQSPTGKPYAVWLGRGLTRHYATMDAYWRSTLLVLLALSALLFVVQLRHATEINRRVHGLAEHMKRLREGNFAGAPPPDTQRDVIAELRESIANATEKLRAARTAQDRLVADAAHELRTPLATMRTTIDLTLRRDRGVDELRQALENAGEEVDRLARLATELLDLAALRGRAVTSERVDLRSIVDDAVHAVASVATMREVELRIAGPAHVELHGLPHELRQAIDNLLTNALAVAPPHSRIELSLEVDGPDLARLIVRDAGPGIPLEQRASVFEPFHRIDRGRSGAGLGLAIVRDIAERHGGRVHVLDEPRHGLAIALELRGAQHNLSVR